MDHFATLGLPRRLVIGAEELRASYDARSREAHPDAGGEVDGFRELQEAYELLRRPGRRLRHWLELETGTFEARAEPPPAIIDLFGEVSGILERLGDLRRRRAGAQSALVRSMAERDAVRILAGTEELQGRVQAMLAEIEGRFPLFEQSGADACREEAEAAACALAFLEKWQGELREAGFALAAGD